MNPPKNRFHGINFHEFYFRESQKIAKKAKVIGLESFRLYSIIALLTLAIPESILIPVDDSVICKAELDSITALNSGLPTELTSFLT